MRFCFPIRNRVSRALECTLLGFVLLAAVAVSAHAQAKAALARTDAAGVRASYRSWAAELRRDQFQWTPLMLAAAANPHPETIAELARLGESVDARSLDGWTALMFAAAFNPNPDVITALIDAGADPDARSPDAWSIHLGASRYTGERVRFDNLGGAGTLVPFGAVTGGAMGDENGAGAAPGNVHANDAVHGWSPLFFAARYNSDPEVLLRLIEVGCDPHARDEYGRAPYYYARRYNPNTAVAEFLAQHEPDR